MPNERITFRVYKYKLKEIYINYVFICVCIFIYLYIYKIHNLYYINKYIIYKYIYR